MARPSKPTRRLKLDNLTLAWKEGWLAFVTAPKRPQPESLSRKALTALSGEARNGYDKSRREWHANLGPIRTPQFASVQEDLWDIVDSNLQDGDKAKGAVALDAFPGLGKTTAVLDFAKKFHLREVGDNGDRTVDGNERWPVCRIGLKGTTGTKSLYKAMLSFYGHPGISSGNADAFAERVLGCVLDCETKILIVDEIHFLRWGNRAGVEVSNSLKHIANDFPITLIYVGVGLEARGLFSEGDSYSDAVLAQTGRRTTRLGMEPFEISTEQGRRDWRSMLLALEERVVLADNDVVVHGYAEILRRGNDLLRHLDVSARGRRIAGWMVVNKDQCSRRQLQRALSHLAHVDGRMIDGASLLHLVSDQLVALVEKQDAELLLLGESHRRAAIVDHRLPG